MVLAGEGLSYERASSASWVTPSARAVTPNHLHIPYVASRLIRSYAPTWAYVGAYDLLGVEHDPLATYRGTSLIRTPPPPWDRHRSLGIGLR